MGNGTKTTRENRTITVDFHDESNYFQPVSYTHLRAHET